MKNSKVCSFSGMVALVATLFAGMGTGVAHAVVVPTVAEEQAVEDIVNAISVRYEQAVDDYNASSPDVVLRWMNDNGSESHIVPVDKPEGLDAAIFAGYSINAGKKVRTVADGHEANLINLDEVVSYLSGNGYAAYDEYDSYFGGTPFYQYYNRTTDIICTLFSSDFACAHRAWFQATDEWGELLNGLGGAYYAKNNKYPILLTDGSSETELPEIKNSAVSPYQYVQIGTLGGFELFYRSGPDAEWVYFGGGNAVIPCSEYTGEAEKGFAGYGCLNDDNEISQVGKKSGILAPDTGANTNDDTNGATPMVAALTLGLFGVAGAYIYKRKRSKEHFVFD